MTITGGSALPKDDIERMMKDAEAHAEEDKKRRDEAETRNLAESLQYQTEKFWPRRRKIPPRRRRSSARRTDLRSRSWLRHRAISPRREGGPRSQEVGGAALRPDRRGRRDRGRGGVGRRREPGPPPADDDVVDARSSRGHRQAAIAPRGEVSVFRPALYHPVRPKKPPSGKSESHNELARDSGVDGPSATAPPPVQAGTWRPAGRADRRASSGSREYATTAAGGPRPPSSSTGGRAVRSPAFPISTTSSGRGPRDLTRLQVGPTGPWLLTASRGAFCGGDPFEPSLQRRSPTRRRGDRRLPHVCGRFPSRRRSADGDVGVHRSRPLGPGATVRD